MFDKLSAHVEHKISKNFDKIIFITSPPSVATRFSTLSKNVNLNGYKVFTTLDTTQFLEKYRHECELVDKFFGDILPTLEKEILRWSKAFYRSRPSNWSFNIQAQRWANNVSLEWDTGWFCKKSYFWLTNDQIRLEMARWNDSWDDS